MSRRNKKRSRGTRTQQPSPRPIPEPTRAPTASAAWIRQRLTAELIEDGHPGTGVGGGGVDALVARDRDGHPVIWASHIEGVLRDAARRLRGRDAAESFFGRRGGGGQRAIFTSLYNTEDPTCRVWRSTARASFENRAPMDDTLRAVEFVPKGTRFEGFVELPPDDLKLLQRLVAEVDALGRGRATGAGRVKLALEGVQTAPRVVGNATSRLLLLLRNLDPVSITATATPDNLIPTLAFVPGRALLGALAAWLLAEGKRDVATALVDGRISVSDALPLPNEPPAIASVEVSPAPLSLQSEKPQGAEGDTPWWALPASPPVRVNKWLAEGGAGGDGGTAPRLKRPEPDLFVCRFGQNSPWTAYRPFLRVRLRNGRPDPEQPDEPSLFAIEQIAERTWFAAELRADAAEMKPVFDALRPVLEGRRWLRIGRGGAPVEVARFECVESGKPSAVGQSATLTLTSDLLVRDKHLRWLTALDGAAFSQIARWPAGVTATPVAQDRASVNGFNGTSRIWRLSAVAIRRGSVFVVDGPGLAELAEAASAGRWLGERTHEGFGRYRLDDVLPGVTSKGSGEIPPGERISTQVQDDAEEAIAATTHAWFDAHKRLAEPGSSSVRRPSLSQWQELIAELERGHADALSSRQRPTTAGKQRWKDQDARAILDSLDSLPSPSRLAHARTFVRWLRAEMRREMRRRAA